MQNPLSVPLLRLCVLARRASARARRACARERRAASVRARVGGKTQRHSGRNKKFGENEMITLPRCGAKLRKKICLKTQTNVRLPQDGAAVMYLGVPATSASAERLFRIAGRTYDDLRQGMKEPDRSRILGTLQKRFGRVNPTSRSPNVHPTHERKKAACSRPLWACRGRLVRATRLFRRRSAAADICSAMLGIREIAPNARTPGNGSTIFSGSGQGSEYAAAKSNLV